jgi:regulatory protein
MDAKDSPFIIAREHALRRLNRRESSSREIGLYLKRKGVDPEIAAEVISELQKNGTLSDERYARLLVRHQAQRSKGARFISSQLKTKGINLDLDKIKTLAEETTDKTELETAVELIRRKYPNTKTDQKEAAKAYQTLIRRGFSHSIAREALSQIKADLIDSG